MKMFDAVKILLTKSNFLYPAALLGAGYWNYKNKRIKNNYFSFDSEEELKKVVNNAVRHIPFYKNLYTSPVVSMADFCNRIGFIDKDTVMNNWDSFLLPNFSENKIIMTTTGGTSGKPLKLILPKSRYIFELASMHSLWQNIGWHGQTRALIRNHHLAEKQIFKINPIQKEVIFDGFRTSQEYFYQIYNILKKYKIKYIHAYPSSAYQFANFLYKEKLNTNIIAGFLCGSEGFMPEHKALIQHKLELRVYHWYGHSEKLVLGGFCKNSELIHIEPTYGYCELVDEHGQAVNQIGQMGEIVGTTLHNPYMPLIRYRTGDFAEYAGNYCPHCKRHLLLLKNICGHREKNKIYKKDGSYITTTALNLHSDLYTKINGMQYFQKEKGKLVVKIIKSDDFTEEDASKFLHHLKISFGTGNEVEIRYVNQLEKLPNGKFQILMSEL
jgi:phenylacetate-CoA ligase